MSALDEKAALYSLDAERSVLAAMMLDEAAIGKAAETVSASCFYRAAHAKTFEAITALHALGSPVDLITVSEELRRAGHMEQVGGPQFLASLMEWAATSANVTQHARIVLEFSKRREALSAAVELERFARDPGGEPLPDGLASRAAALSQLSKGVAGSLSLAESSIRFGAEPARADELPTSFVGEGLICRGDLVLLAGKPGLGKSRISLELAHSLSTAQPFFGLETGSTARRVGYIAAEFTRYRWWQRSVRLMTGQAPPEEPEALQRAYRTLGMHIAVLPGDFMPGPVDLFSRAISGQVEDMVRELGLEVLILDPLARFMGGKDETNEFFGPLVATLDRIRFNTHCTIIVVHHERKGGTDGKEQDDLEAIRGGMKLVDGCNTVLRLSKAKEGGLLKLSFPKANYARTPETVWLRVPEDGGRTLMEANPESKKDANKARVLSWVMSIGGAVTASQVSMALEMSRVTARQHLETLVSERSVSFEVGERGARLYRFEGTEWS